DGLWIPAQPAGDPARPLRRHRARPDRRLPAVPLDHLDSRRQGARGHPRQRDPRALLRVFAGGLQAVRVRRLGGARRDRRRPVRATGGDHHAREDRGAALDRDGRVGRRGRARHPLRRGPRGVRRELDPELAHHQLPRFLAPLPGRPLHGRGPVLSRRRRRRPRPTGVSASSDRVAPARSGGLDPQRLARTADAMSPPPAPEAVTHATSIIYLEDVTVNYDGFKALSRLNFFMERRDRILHTLETVQLADKADGKAGALSHGEKQWLEIGMMIAQDPELLLVDEPVAGMTDEETARTGELLEAIAADRSVLVIEHDME